MVPRITLLVRGVFCLKGDCMKDNLIISMSKFLFIYHNFDGDVIRKITHDQLNGILNIKNVSDDKIATQDIISGKIILVKDCKGVVQGYRNPFVDKKDFVEEEPLNLDITFDEKSYIDIQNLSDYSDYELEELIKECKKANNDKDKNVIIKELKQRECEEKNNKNKILEKVRKRELRED